MIIKKSVIRRALLKAKPEDLEDVLSAIEAYRICVGASRKLDGQSRLGAHRNQVLECAEQCERALVDYAVNGRLPPIEYPSLGRGATAGVVHFMLTMH